MAAKMHSDLVKQLEVIRARRAFDAASWVDAKTTALNDYMRRCGLKGGVVSVSGGVDSAVTLALMVAASKKPDSPMKRVLGIAQPIHSTPAIQNRAFEVARALGADIITVDQTSLHTQLVGIVKEAMHVEPSAFAAGQLRSYMRTPVNFYVAQVLSQEGFPAIVFGTGNMDEDGYLLYFCKCGDGVADVQLIADIHKSEVFAVGKHLGVPESILVAPPSADLWEGQTDEDELGFSYDFVELFTEVLAGTDADRAAFKAAVSAEAWEQFVKLGTAAEVIHRRNKHKADKYPLNINDPRYELRIPSTPVSSL